MKNCDFYGQQINLTYKGDNSFKTTPGAVVSILITALLLAFSIYKLYVLVNRQDTNISKSSLMRDLKSEPAFRPQDYGFDFAFGIG